MEFFKLDRRITIENRDDQPGEAFSGETTPVEEVERWANRKDITSAEADYGGAVYTAVRTEFTIRAEDAPGWKVRDMKIIDGDQNFNVKGRIEREERGRFITYFALLT